MHLLYSHTLGVEWCSIVLVLPPSHRSSTLARIMHQLSTAVPQASTLTALCFLVLLGDLHEYACGALGVPACGSHALSSRRLRHFVTRTYASSGLAGITLHHQDTGRAAPLTPDRRLCPRPSDRFYRSLALLFSCSAPRAHPHPLFRGT